jgi:hypothetical protein
MLACKSVVLKVHRDGGIFMLVTHQNGPENKQEQPFAL